MEYRSKHPIDVLRWIEKVIDSCQTYEQTHTAYTLVNKCYRDMYIGNKGFNSPLFNEWRRVGDAIFIKQLNLSNKK
jgi:hypothetical protein